MLQAPLSKGAEGHVRLTVFRLTRVLAVAGVVTGEGCGSGRVAELARLLAGLSPTCQQGLQHIPILL